MELQGVSQGHGVRESRAQLAEGVTRGAGKKIHVRTGEDFAHCQMPRIDLPLTARKLQDVTVERPDKALVMSGLLHAGIRAYPGELEGYIKLDKELWDELAGRLGGTPDDVPEAYEKASGHTQAWKIQSPILIVSGDSEYVPHCLTMVAALLKARKDCAFAVYENAPHAFWWNGLGIPARVEADEKIFSFLEAHLKGKQRPGGVVY